MKISETFVVITGASSGIGAATARALAVRGAHVALLARTAETLEQLATDIRQTGGQAWAYVVDLTQPEAVEAIAQRIQAEHGAPDILLNSAGAGRWLFAEETDPAEMVQMMAAPYFAAFLITRAFLPAMLKRKSGLIININSPAARVPWPGATGYAAARWALQGFTQALRGDVFNTGVRVMSVVSGKVDTAYFTSNAGTEARAPAIGKIIPTLTADQVAAAIVRGIEHNQREVVVPFMLRMFYALHHLFPRLMEELVIRTGWQHETLDD